MAESQTLDNGKNLEEEDKRAIANIAKGKTMPDSCKFCGEHNLYGQRLASHEVRIEDLKETVKESKSDIVNIFKSLDQYCTKKAVTFFITCLLTIACSGIGSSVWSVSKLADKVERLTINVETLNVKVETIQKILENANHAVSKTK